MTILLPFIAHEKVVVRKNIRFLVGFCGRID
jgi:hypothetical protein